MCSGFAYEMQLKAERLAESFADQIYGVKCWYSSVRLLDQESKRVFLSINPGGDRPDPWEDQMAPYVDPQHNAWLDQDWGKGPGGTPHQKRAVKVFDALYGTNGKSVLRGTPSFPVAPFRTPRANMLPASAWQAAKSWFWEVLEHLKPCVILCNGNSETKSPWSVLCERYEVRRIKRTKVGRTAFLKEGIIHSGDLRGTKIIATPHLTGAVFKEETLLKELKEIKKRMCQYR